MAKKTTGEPSTTAAAKKVATSKTAKPVTLAEITRMTRTDKNVPKLEAAIEQHGAAAVMKALRETDVLRDAIAGGARALVDLLLRHGIDADARPDDALRVRRNPGPLAALLRSDRWEREERGAAGM